MVSTNLLDLWSHPQYGSERVNQLLFHDLVEMGAVRKGFARVRKEDGYKGWADRRFLVPVSKAEYVKRKTGKRVMVVAGQTRLYGTDGSPAEPFILYYGTRLLPVGRKSGLIAIRTVGESSVYVKPGAIEPILGRKGKAVTGSRLVAEAKRFLGVPYLWGGLSPLGFDCSGLVQAVGARFGLTLPRDTRDQIKAGRKIPLSEIRPGDLLFFDRHVGFAVSGGRLIHASMGGSGVRINSLRKGEPACREDLAESLKQARRVV